MAADSDGKYVQESRAAVCSFKKGRQPPSPPSLFLGMLVVASSLHVSDGLLCFRKTSQMAYEVASSGLKVLG